LETVGQMQFRGLDLGLDGGRGPKAET
jgi:hypothetical protein